MAEPIFVTGPDRSGTSLLYALLGSHPEISMVRRTNLFRWFYDRFGDLADVDNFERCLSTMLRYQRMAPLEPDAESIRAEFAAGEPTYARLFEIVHRQHADRLAKRRWGDKSLHTEHFADDVFEAFPHARMLHVMRDPRDRHASVMRRYDRVDKNIGSVTARWTASASAARRNVRKHGDRYLLVRYEDLVTDVRGVLGGICRFIGEEFREEMLDMGGVPEHELGNSSFGSFAPRTISASAVGRYRTVLRPEEVTFIELAAGGHMRRLGYSVEGLARGPFPLRALPSLASDLFRLVAWRAMVGERRGRRHEVPAARLRPEVGHDR